MKRYFGAFLFFAFLISCQQNPDDNLHVYNGFTMGTTYSIKVLGESDSSIDYDMLKGKIDSILVEVNRQMSTYIDTSEISKFNKSLANEWISVSADLIKVIDAAKWISSVSGGAFDITVGPLVNLWGFGTENKEFEIPSEDEINQIKPIVGYDKVSVDFNANSLSKTTDGISCDLSAIAKGFGVDKVGKYFEHLGIENYLVEIGGEIRTRGINQHGKIWAIGISRPDSYSGIQQAITLHNLSMATSGDYRNYFEEDGVRYSHTIDPRTGRPIVHNLASVTVLHEDCMMADAIATAIDVLGKKEGLKLAEELDVPVYMIIRKGKVFEEVMSGSFRMLLIKSN
ncbi:MAG: FAD:protein FMN transferase [Bacteroidetes bacterium]|nr:FAD:protein FMN transferase [Bacteroidota bacterium]